MKKAFSILEVTLYVLIVSVVWVYVTFIVSRYFEYLDANKTSMIFAQNYDKIVKNFYSKNRDGWVFSWIAWTGLVFMANSWNYQWIACMESWLAFTNISSLTWSLDWTGNYDQFFSWFECQNFTWVSSTSWYWLDITTNFYWKDLQEKYYFKK